MFPEFLMESRATPVCKVLLLCRQLFVARLRQDYKLSCPGHQVFHPGYPVLEQLSVVAR